MGLIFGPNNQKNTRLCSKWRRKSNRSQVEPVSAACQGKPNGRRVTRKWNKYVQARQARFSSCTGIYVQVWLYSHVSFFGQRFDSFGVHFNTKAIGRLRLSRSMGLVYLPIYPSGGCTYLRGFNWFSSASTHDGKRFDSFGVHTPIVIIHINE